MESDSRLERHFIVKKITRETSVIRSSRKKLLVELIWKQINRIGHLSFEDGDMKHCRDTNAFIARFCVILSSMMASRDIDDMREKLANFVEAMNIQTDAVSEKVSRRKARYKAAFKMVQDALIELHGRLPVPGIAGLPVIKEGSSPESDVSEVEETSQPRDGLGTITKAEFARKFHRLEGMIHELGEISKGVGSSQKELALTENLCTLTSLLQRMQQHYSERSRESVEDSHFSSAAEITLEDGMTDEKIGGSRLVGLRKIAEANIPRHQLSPSIQKFDWHDSYYENPSCKKDKIEKNQLFVDSDGVGSLEPCQFEAVNGYDNQKLEGLMTFRTMSEQKTLQTQEQENLEEEGSSQIEAVEEQIIPLSMGPEEVKAKSDTAGYHTSATDSDRTPHYMYSDLSADKCSLSERCGHVPETLHPRLPSTQSFTDDAYIQPAFQHVKAEPEIIADKQTRHPEEMTFNNGHLKLLSSHSAVSNIKPLIVEPRQDVAPQWSGQDTQILEQPTMYAGAPVLCDMCSREVHASPVQDTSHTSQFPCPCHDNQTGSFITANTPELVQASEQSRKNTSSLWWHPLQSNLQKVMTTLFPSLDKEVHSSAHTIRRRRLVFTPSQTSTPRISRVLAAIHMNMESWERTQTYLDRLEWWLIMGLVMVVVILLLVMWMKNHLLGCSWRSGLAQDVCKFLEVVDNSVLELRHYGPVVY